MTSILAGGCLGLQDRAQRERGKDEFPGRHSDEDLLEGGVSISRKTGSARPRSSSIPTFFSARCCVPKATIERGMLLTIRIPEGKHARLRSLARGSGISINKLVDELATVALAQHDTEARFRALAVRGSKKEGLALLAKLDRKFASR